MMAAAGGLSVLGFGQIFGRFTFLSTRSSLKLCGFIARQRSCIDGRRYLFSSEILGLEGYKRQKATMTDKMGSIKENFFQRLEDYLGASESNTIFTDDLKTMVYFTETDSELNTFLKMVKRFHLQNNEMRFSGFVFGPLVMRLLHILNKPNISLELFTDKSLNGFFDQSTSFVVLMDLLFESKMYSSVLDVMDLIKEKQSTGLKFPADCLTLVTASCYKMNTEDSLQKVISLLKEKENVEATSNVSTRSAVYASMLALKQQKPNIALEMFAMIPHERIESLPVACVNVRILIYLSLGRLDEVILHLRAVLEQDVPDHVKKGGDIFDGILKQVQAAISKDGNKELQRQFEMVEKGLKSGLHVTDQDFDEYLSSPVLRQRRLQDGYKQRDRFQVGGFKRTSRNKFYSRPGLYNS